MGRERMCVAPSRNDVGLGDRRAGRAPVLILDPPQTDTLQRRTAFNGLIAAIPGT